MSPVPHGHECLPMPSFGECEGPFAVLLLPQSWPDLLPKMTSGTSGSLQKRKTQVPFTLLMQVRIWQVINSQDRWTTWYCVYSLCDSLYSNKFMTDCKYCTSCSDKSFQCFVYLVKGTSVPLENLHILLHKSEPAAGNICWQHLGWMEEFLQGWQRFLSPSWGLPGLSLH